MSGSSAYPGRVPLREVERGSGPPVDAWMLPGALSRLAGRPGRMRTPRDWAVDLTAFGFAVAWAAFQLGILLRGAYGLPDWLRIVDVVIGGAGCLAVWWRRRFPAVTAYAAAV